MEISKAVHYFITAIETEQLSNHSVRAYKQDLNQFCTATLKTNLDELDFEDFQNYFISLSHLKIPSVKRKRVVLHRFLKFCYRKKLCSKKLFEYIDPIKSKKTNVPKQVLAKDEITKIFDFLKAEKYYFYSKLGHSYYEYLYYCALRNQLLVSILLYTGCRAHEAVAIKKQDINLPNNTILLLAKGNKYNQIPIHSELQAALSQYYYEVKGIQDPDILAMLQSDYLFPSRLNLAAHLSTRSLHDVMKRLSSELNKPIHAHLFRHTFASYCIAANMDITTISSLISHSNPSITLSIYTHEIDAHNKQEQIKKLNFT